MVLHEDSSDSATSQPHPPPPALRPTPPPPPRNGYNKCLYTNIPRTFYFTYM